MEDRDTDKTIKKFLTDELLSSKNKCASTAKDAGNDPQRYYDQLIIPTLYEDEIDVDGLPRETASSDMVKKWMDNLSRQSK